MKKITAIVLSLVSFVSASAYTERNILASKTTEQGLAEMLVADRKWVPLPSYSDRQGWDSIFGDSREFYIKRGEKALSHDWPRVKATDYLEFERSGNRKIMENPLSANNEAMASLLLAELAEGKGRFVDQIINGIYAASEMTSWSLSAHNPNQPSKRSIQAYDYPMIDLVAGGMGNLYSWVYYFMKPELDKVDPEISRRLKHEIKVRILDPYLAVDNWWWDGSRRYTGRMLNNWSPWCLSNVLLTSMLMEDDKERMARTAWLTLLGTDKFLNYIKGDGACEEGPSYWGHAAGKTLDYIDILKLATGGKLDFSDNQLIRDMGEYIAKSYVGNGWVVNFADASAKGSADPYLVYRYGREMNSDLLKQFAAMMNTAQKPPFYGIDMFRTLRALPVKDKIGQGGEMKHPARVWYPETEFCYFTTPQGLFFATKGGFNDESHNHNDVGTFSLWADNEPIIIDAGVGTYTRQTFSSERYSIWTMQSGWHNLPVVNGVEQRFGRKFKASDVKVGKNTFDVELASAYPDEAKVNSWRRKYEVKGREVKVSDTYDLSEAVAPNAINLLVWGTIDTSTPGKILVETQGHKAEIAYDASRLTASVAEQELPDVRLSNVWGSKISRITLRDSQPSKKGSYKYSIKVKNNIP